MKNLAAANPELASVLTALAAGLAVLIAGFGALTLALTSILGLFIVIRYGLSLMGIQAGGLFGVLANLARSGFGMLGKAILFVGRLFLANPIGLAVTAIGLATYAIYRYWEPISGFFSGLWSNIATAFNSAVQWLSGLLAGWDPLSVLDAAWGAVAGFFGQIWQSVTKVFDGSLTCVGAMLMNWSPLGLLYQPIAAALASAPRQITVQGDTINITIQGAAMSQAELQRTVETALRRAQADKDARFRSAYIDRD